jgi:hypothetical protein
MDGARCKRAEGGLSVGSKGRWNSIVARKRARMGSDRPELWWKFFEEFVVLSAGTGSFDCVRLRLTSLRRQF